MKRWKPLKYGANGTSVFRIHIESELKLGLSVSITLLAPGGGAGIRSKFKTWTKLGDFKSGCAWWAGIQHRHSHPHYNVIIRKAADHNPVNLPGARLAGLYGCPICGLGLTPPELEEHFTQEVPPATSPSWLPWLSYQSSSWLPINNLQVDFLAKLSLGLSLSDQRSPDPAPRTRWDVSDYDEIVWHVVVTLTEM